jgi:hypothetical protein
LSHLHFRWRISSLMIIKQCSSFLSYQLYSRHDGKEMLSNFRRISISADVFPVWWLQSNAQVPCPSPIYQLS